MTSSERGRCAWVHACMHVCACNACWYVLALDRGTQGAQAQPLLPPPLQQYKRCMASVLHERVAVNKTLAEQGQQSYRSAVVGEGLGEGSRVCVRARVCVCVCVRVRACVCVCVCMKTARK